MMMREVGSSSKGITKETPIFPPGARFGPTDLGLVRLYLRNMVERHKSSFITTLDVYSDEPWLLDHVHDDLFREKEWYYFVPRIKRRGKGVDRTVPGRRKGSEGGTWRSNTAKTEIKDENNKVEGYKQNLEYRKIVNREQTKTDWLMTEYCLHKGAQDDDLVLCRIRDNSKSKVKGVLVGQVPQVDNNNILLGANQVQMMMVEGDHHGDATQPQQQLQEQETPTLYLPPPQGQDPGLETMMMMTTTQSNNNNNNVMMMPYHEEQNQLDGLSFEGLEDWMLDIDDITLQEPISQGQDPGGLSGQVMFTSN